MLSDFWLNTGFPWLGRCFEKLRMESSPYEMLRNFIVNRMRMSHVYQPVMLMTLLQAHGTATEREIARSILVHDESQLEYYANITNNMVGRVLRKYGIVSKASGVYSLSNFDVLTDQQVDELVALCQSKLDAFLEKRGDRIFQHRRLSSGYIS